MDLFAQRTWSFLWFGGLIVLSGVRVRGEILRQKGFEGESLFSAGGFPRQGRFGGFS